MRLDRRRKILLACTLVQVVLLGAILTRGAADMQRHGWIGIGAWKDFQADTEPGRISIVAPGSPADRAGLQAGDRIVAVRGVPVEDRPAIERLADEIERGDPVEYEVARGEDPAERLTLTMVPGNLFTSLAFLPVLLATLLVGTAYWGISLLVFWARPGSRSAFVFYLLCSAMGWLFFLVLALLTATSRPLAWASPAGSLLASALVAIMSFVALSLFLHLALVFPREHPVLDRHPRILGWIYGLPPVVVGGEVLMGLLGGEFFEYGVVPWLLEAILICGIAVLTWRLCRVGRGRLVDRPLEGLAWILAVLLASSPLLEVVSRGNLVFLVLFWISFLVLALGYPILTCWISYRAYRESTPEEKLQLRWPLWGLIVGLGGSLLAGLCPAVLSLVSGWKLGSVGTTSHPSELVVVSIAAETVSHLFYLLVPVGFAFGILKHRLLEINVLIRKTLIYAALTGFVLFGYFVLVGIVGLLLITYTGIEGQLWAVVSTVIIAALFVPVRTRVQGFVERRFGDQDSAEELRQARAIQSSLLPRGEVEQLPGFEIAALWEPALTVSGDYFDVLTLPEGRLGLCIGDVSGKGMPAALLMSSLQAAVKAVAPTTRDPGEVCRQVRQVVTRNLSGGKFVTFFYAILDENGRLTYSNAGHNPPVLVRADGSLERLSTEGSAFARLFSDAESECGSVELLAGDRLVLFTDGATEVFDYDGVELGEPGLAALVHRHRELSARQLHREVAEGVRRHAEGELTDDLTLLVVSA